MAQYQIEYKWPKWSKWKTLRGMRFDNREDAINKEHRLRIWNAGEFRIRSINLPIGQMEEGD